MSTLHAWLEFTDAQTGSPRRVDVDGNTLTIGRTGGDLRLVDSDLSEIHAILCHERGGFVLRDLGSQSGTFVNNRPVIEAELTNLDEIRLGHTVLIFHASYQYRARTPESQAEAAAAALTTEAAPGHRAESPTRNRGLVPFAVFLHPLRFWPQALETSVFNFRRTAFHHLLIAAILAASARFNSAGLPLLHLSFLVFSATVALLLTAITCSVFFAFESLPDAPHRLSQALRFTFFLAPYMLLAQVAFLSWAAHQHPTSSHYFLAAGAPTVIIWMLMAFESRFAFGSSLSRGLAFAITASVPWNLLMTGLMSLLV